MNNNKLDFVSQFLHVLEGKEVRPATPREFEEFWRDFDRRVIRKTKLWNVLVSTVFTGVDGQYDPNTPPRFFHTKVYGGPMDGESWWYATYDEALEGHVSVCETVVNKLKTDES